MFIGISPSGRNAKRRGIEPPGAQVVKRTKEYLVLKIKGHSYWSGIGQQSYAPTDFEVYKIEDVRADDIGETITATLLIDFPARS